MSSPRQGSRPGKAPLIIHTPTKTVYEMNVLSGALPYHPIGVMRINIDEQKDSVTVEADWKPGRNVV